MSKVKKVLNEVEKENLKPIRRINIVSHRDCQRLIARLANMLYSDEILPEKVKAFCSLINSFSKSKTAEKLDKSNCFGKIVVKLPPEFEEN